MTSLPKAVCTGKLARLAVLMFILVAIHSTMGSGYNGKPGAASLLQLHRNNRSRSVSALAGKYRTGCLEKDRYVREQGPALGIAQVQPYHFVKSCFASPMNLPEAGNAWLSLPQSPTMPNFVRLELVANWRAWRKQRHFPAQNVPELRELVQAGSPHEFTNSSDAGIIRDFIDAPSIPIG